MLPSLELHPRADEEEYEVTEEGYLESYHRGQGAEVEALDQGCETDWPIAEVEECAEPLHP